jgi:hypothetical protein
LPSWRSFPEGNKSISPGLPPSSVRAGSKWPRHPQV